jgi:predicted amidohydrolase
MTKHPIRIATAQSRVSASVKENGNEIRQLMKAAKEQNAALIHFTEGALSGYAKSQIKSWAEVDWNELLQEQLQIAEDAKKLGIWVVFGCNHRLSEPNRPHNSLYVVSDTGEVVTRYDKRWCSNTEIKDWYTPGKDSCIFDVNGWRFGCALCIEIQFPEVFAEYAIEKVDCLLFSAYSDDVMYGIQAQGYAAIYNYWISCAVPHKSVSGLTSRLIGPSGAIQMVSEVSASCILIGELNTENPEWKNSLKYAKPWRALAREGKIYQERMVFDPRSVNKVGF